MERLFCGHEIEVLVGRRRILGAADVINAHRELSGLSGQVLTSVEWFLAKREIWNYLPIAVLSRRDGVLQGVALLQYPRVFGVPYGLVRGGARGDLGVIAPVAEQPRVAETAAQFLVHHALAHTVILTLPCRVQVTDQRMWRGRNLWAKWHLRERTQRLSLMGGLEATMQRLGYKLRRNLRRYRRLADGEGLRFLPELSPAQRNDAVATLFNKGRYPTPPRRARTWERTLQDVPGAFAMGLQSPAGEWLSYVAGWREPNATYVDWQLNDERTRRDSISTVTRSHLLEHETGRNVARLVLVGGTSAIWSAACEVTTESDLLVTRTGPVARTMQRALRHLRPEMDVASLYEPTSV